MIQTDLGSLILIQITPQERTFRVSQRDETNGGKLIKLHPGCQNLFLRVFPFLVSQPVGGTPKKVGLGCAAHLTKPLYYL